MYMNDKIEILKYSFCMKSNKKTLARINLTHVLLNFSNFICGQITKSLITTNLRDCCQALKIRTK